MLIINKNQRIFVSAAFTNQLNCPATFKFFNYLKL